MAEEIKTNDSEKELLEKEERKKALEDQIAGLETEKERIVQETIEAREERRQAAAEAVVAKKDDETGVDDDLSTQESWLKRIDSTSKSAVAPVLSELEKLKEAQRKKAERQFLEKHKSEYKSGDDPKFKTLSDTYTRIRSRSEHDADDIFEDFEDAWAMTNRAVIEAEVKKVREQAGEIESFEKSQATTTHISGSEKVDNPTIDASKKDYEAARKLGKSITDYLKLKEQYERTHI